MESFSEPWSERDDWVSSRLESLTGGRVPIVFLWLFAALWNGFSGFVPIEAARGNVTGHPELALLFTAAGAGIFALAVQLTLRYRKWGRSQLELLTYPAYSAGPCAASCTPLQAWRLPTRWR